jgi:hypothetical protein
MRKNVNISSGLTEWGAQSMMGCRWRRKDHDAKPVSI